MAILALLAGPAGISPPEGARQFIAPVPYPVHSESNEAHEAGGTAAAAWPEHSGNGGDLTVFMLPAQESPWGGPAAALAAGVAAEDGRQQQGQCDNEGEHPLHDPRVDEGQDEDNE